MSLIKNYYHDEICSRNNHFDMIDADYRYELFKEQQEIEYYEKEAEKAEFFTISEISGSFPM